MQNLLEKFSNVRVLIVGDVMIDQYWWGSVERISPEAPVPIVNLKKKSLVAGGAANVAANIAGLGAKPYLIGVVGGDSESESFSKILDNINVSSENLVYLENRPTTVKTRIIAHSQQITRIDHENTSLLNFDEEELLWKQIELVIDETDIVLISDYAKGVVTENIAMRLITTSVSKNKFVIVDPKGKNYQKYKFATILTPNQKEAFEATGLENTEENTIDSVGKQLLENLSLEGLIVTRGEDGMTLFQNHKESQNLPASARNVYDVTGAGDTVIATLTVAIGAGSDFFTAAKLANLAAGFVVEKVGTTAIKVSDLASLI